MNFKPTDLTDQRAVLRAAFNCGLYLKPDDWRSAWLDELPQPLRGRACESYHAGQAERYEQEDW